MKSHHQKKIFNYEGEALLPVQIIDLAVNSHALHHQHASGTSVKLRELAKKLNVQADNIRKHLKEQQLISET